MTQYLVLASEGRQRYPIYTKKLKIKGEKNKYSDKSKEETRWLLGKKKKPSQKSLVSVSLKKDKKNTFE
jgi:hypothetical protein